MEGLRLIRWNNNNFEHLDLEAIQRGIEKKGYDGTKYSNAYDAVADYDNSVSAGIAAFFSPFLGISVVIHEIYHYVTASRIEVDFSGFSEAILNYGQGYEANVGQFYIEDQGHCVIISDSRHPQKKPFQYDGTMAELKKELAYSIYKVSTSSSDKSIPQEIKKIQADIDSGKKYLITNSNKQIIRSEFEYAPSSRMGKANDHEISSMDVLQFQFNYFVDEGKKVAEAALLKNEVVYQDNLENVLQEKAKEGKLVVYISEHDIEKVWRECQLLVQSGTFSNIKCYFADPTNTVRPEENKNDYPIVFYVEDFYCKEVVEGARNLLVERGIIKQDSKTTFIDTQSPEKNWEYPNFPPQAIQ